MLLGRPATLSNAPQEALQQYSIIQTVCATVWHDADRIAVEQELLAAAAEKSEVTMRPNASQGEVNWAMGALPAIAPCNSSEVWISSSPLPEWTCTMCGYLVLSQAASIPP